MSLRIINKYFNYYLGQILPQETGLYFAIMIDILKFAVNSTKEISSLTCKCSHKENNGSNVVWVIEEVNPI